MAIVFPSNPNTNDTFTAGSITYKWDGDKWIGLGVTPTDRLLEGSNSLEINANNDLVWTGNQFHVVDTAETTSSLFVGSTKKSSWQAQDNFATILYSYDDEPLVFSVSSGASFSRKLTIATGGEVSIGNFIPTASAGVLQIAGGLRVAGSASASDTTSPYIYRTSGVDHLNFATSGVERFRIKSNGDLKHTGLRSGGGENKLAILVTPSHNTNEEDVIVYQVENEGSFNQITFGGGTASYNAATKLVFKTASAVDTTGGTERFSIDSNGIVRSHSDGIDGSSLTLDLTSNQIVAGFQAKETSGNAQALSGFWFNHGGLNAGIASTRQVTNQWGTDIRFYTHPFTVSDQHKVYERFKIDPDGRIFFRDLLGNASSGSAVKYNNSDDELRYDTSSRLLKTNITECPYGIETVKKLKPSRYTPQEYDREGNINVTDEVLIGFIADEMVEEVPEVVQMYPKSTLTRNNEDTEIVPAAISYDKLTAVLTKALQEAIVEIETLKGRLDAAGL
jgi:hypothetical protein